MENVGESKSRNSEFLEKFDRGKLLKSIVTTDEPVIFDVGAHFGESVAYLKKLFPKATVYSFEPDPDSFATLSNTAMDGVSYFNLAISDTDGTASFYRNRISHTNSLLKVNLDSEDSIAISKANAKKDTEFLDSFNEEVEVATIRLDSFTKRHSIGQIDLLKIDVQGAERRALLGGEAALRKTKAIVVEIIFFDYYEDRTAFIDVESVIAPLGFRLFSISDISNNPMNGRTDWAEVVYLNQNLIKT